MSLKNRHAVVTGGGSGIGLSIALYLLNEGATVTIMGRNKERLNNIAKDYENMFAISVDVTNQNSVHNAFQQASKIKNIDILVNNAGAAKAVPFHKMSLENWQSMLDVNLTGTFLTTKAVLENIKRSENGRIINIASTAGIKGYAYVSAYSAAKHGVIGLTKSLAIELEQSNVKVNAICPGYTNTDIVRNTIQNIMEKTGRSHKEALNDILATDGQKRLVEPEEVAEKVVNLCSMDNTRNGEIILITGEEEE